MVILTQIILPYPLSIPEGETVEFYFNNENVIINPKPVIGSRIASYRSQDANWLNDLRDNEAFRYSYNTADGNETFYRTTVFNESDIDFLIGHSDVTKYTILDIIIAHNATEIQVPSQDFDRIKEKVNNILIYFINTYKAYTGDSDVYIPATFETPITSYYHSVDSVHENGTVSGTFNVLARVHNGAEFTVAGLSKGVFNQEQKQGFQDMLNNPDAVPVFRQLLAEAKHHQLVRNDYKIAIITVANAFEVYMQARLISECEHRGITSIPVGRGQATIQKSYDRAIYDGNVREDLLGKISRYLTNDSSIKNSREFQQWFDHTHEVRNEIIHRGRHIATLAEASLAYDCVTNLMTHVNNRLIATR
jgi:hypothetical protein